MVIPDYLKQKLQTGGKRYKPKTRWYTTKKGMSISIIQKARMGSQAKAGYTTLNTHAASAFEATPGLDQPLELIVVCSCS